MAPANEQFDVVVVGGGSAAHEAAIAASAAGAKRVVLLEKAPQSEYGGNARFSATGFRFAFEPDEIRVLTDTSVEDFADTRIRPYTEEMFMADLMRVTQGRIDQELANVLVSGSNPAVYWAKEIGFKWSYGAGTVIDGLRYYNPGIPMHPMNLGAGMTNGMSQLIQWQAIAGRFGVEIRYDSKIIGFLGDESAVTGVQVLGPDGTYEARAGAVVAAAGGFQANSEMRARYLGTNADLMKVRGSRHDTGEVLEMLLALGAQPSGNWSGAHATPIDAMAPNIESGDLANRYGYPFSITVNENGQRFIDEGEAERSYTYAKTGWAVLREQGGVAYQIGDAKTRADNPSQTLNYWPTDEQKKRAEAAIETGDVAERTGERSASQPIEAATVRELAGKIGIDPTILEHTVNEFNDAIDKSIPYDRTKRDGRHTAGLSPNKSNWSLEMDTAPFYAVPVTGGITFTFGGVKVNTDAQLMSTSGKPIRGLFATGDILGLFWHNYPSMTGQTRNLVFARLAGEGAAKG